MNYRQRFVTLYRRQGSRPSPRKRNAKKINGCLRSLTNSCEKKRGEKQRRKGKIYHLKAQFQRIPKRDRKGFLTDKCKEIEENNRMGKTRDIFTKIRDTISCKDGHNKGQKWYVPNRSRRY